MCIRDSYFTAEVGNGRAALNGTDAHHLADVMRAKIGENVILCDTHAVEYVGTITSIQPGRVEFNVTEGYPSAAEPSVEVTLFAGYPKLGKLEAVSYTHLLRFPGIWTAADLLWLFLLPHLLPLSVCSLLIFRILPVR